MLVLATVSDLEVVASWIKTRQDCELWAGGRVSFPIDRRVLPACIQFDETNAWTWRHMSTPVAFGQLIVKERRRGHIARVIVHPCSRRLGYGAMLVHALVDEARDQMLERVSLNVDASNVCALALYRRLDFVDVDRPKEEPPRTGSRYMERRL